MLPDAIESALIAIVEQLEERHVDYCVGGSAMLALDGFDVPVGDLDFVVDANSRAVIDEMFPAAHARSTTDRWRSRWSLRGHRDVAGTQVGVDLIGDLRLIIDGELARFPLVAEHWVPVGEVDVAVAPLRHWYHLYRMHRPEKAALIASRLTDDEISTGARELGIGDRFSPTLIVRIGNES